MPLSNKPTLLIVAPAGGGTLDFALEQCAVQFGECEISILGSSEFIGHLRGPEFKPLTWDEDIYNWTASGHPLSGSIPGQWDYVAVLDNIDPSFVSTACAVVARCAVALFWAPAQLKTIVLPRHDPEYPSTSVDFRRRFLLCHLPSARPAEISTGVFTSHPLWGYSYHPGARFDASHTVPPSFGHGSIWQFDKDGFRNPEFPHTKPADEYWVGFLGGSVAFSSHSSSNETAITGLLERGMNELLQTSRSARFKKVRVLNLAIGAGRSPMQTHILVHYRTRLDAIITFDGHNEIAGCHDSKFRLPLQFPCALFYNIFHAKKFSDEQRALTWLLNEMNLDGSTVANALSSLPPTARQSIEGEVRSVLRRSNTDHSVDISSLFEQCGPQFLDESVSRFLDRCVELWVDEIVTMHKLCKSFNKESLFIMQPLISVAKKLTPSEEALRDAVDPEMMRFVMAGRDKMESAFEVLRDDGIPCFDFKNIFEDREDEVYADHVHFGDLGNSIVAAGIMKLIKENFEIFNGQR